MDWLTGQRVIFGILCHLPEIKRAEKQMLSCWTWIVRRTKTISPRCLHIENSGRINNMPAHSASRIPFRRGTLHMPQPEFLSFRGELFTLSLRWGFFYLIAQHLLIIDRADPQKKHKTESCALERPGFLGPHLRWQNILSNF